MIDNSENIESSKTNSPKNKRTWLKVTIAIAILVLTSWLIFYFFSTLLFSTVIKRVFSETTKQEYSLAFENLKINIFTRKITFYQTLIQRTEKVINQDDPNISFSSGTVVFQNIDLFALGKYQILKLENVSINNCEIEFKKQINTVEQKKLLLPLSAYFKAIKILNFKVADAKIKYAQENDLLFIPALNFELQEFSIDSLSDTVKNNRFHFADMFLHIKNQQFYLPDKSHFLSWENLEFSTKEKYFELNNFYIIPYNTVNTQQKYTADIPKFRMEQFEFDSLIDKKQLIAKNLLLEINRFNILFNKIQGKAESYSFKEQLDAFFVDNFNKIDIDSVSIAINESKISLLKNQQLNFHGKSYLTIEHFKYDPTNNSKYSLVDAELDFNDIVFNNSQNKQELRFKQGQLNYQNQNFSIHGIDFISDSTEEINLHLEEIQLEKIDWVNLLNANQLIAENLLLINGDFVQQHVSKSKASFDNLAKLDSAFSPVFKVIKINNIQFENWNYSLASRAINAENIDAHISQFQIPSDLSLPFGAFSDFESKINQLSWVSKNQRHHYLAKDIDVNSSSKNISISNVQSFPRWKTLKNQNVEDGQRFKFFGNNIKITTKKPFHKIKLNETLILSKLSIDSLSLQQFGKNIGKEKIKSGIPPIHIYSFELRKGDFEAYKDNSVVSKLAQINGIHLQGDSLEIYNDQQFQINYRHLFAVTSNGFYQNKAQGLKFNFQKVDFDSNKETMSIHQFESELKSENNEKSSQHKLNSKLVQIKGFDHNLYLQRNLISAKEFKLNSPNLISKSQSDSAQQSSDFRHLFSAENLEHLPYLEFDRFIIRDLTWLATYTVVGNTTISSFEKANLDAIDFQLSYRSFINPERIFFSQTFDFHIQNIKQHFQNGNYLLIVKNIDFYSLQRQLNFDKIQFYTLQKADQNNYSFTIDRISFDKINFANFSRNQSLTIGNILIRKPISKLRLYGFNENSTIKNLNTLDLFPILKPFFSQIIFNSIDVQDMNMKLEVPRPNSTNIYNLGRINLYMQQFRVDSTTKAFKNNRFFYTQNTLIHLRDYSASISNDLYKMEFKNLRLSTQKGIVEIDSASLKPQYGYEDFAGRSQYQTDRFDVAVKNIKLSGIDFQDALFREKYNARTAEINQLKGEVYRDGTYPRLPDYYPTNPLQKLLALPYVIQVDSLLVNDSYIAYKELGANTNQPGHIYFENLNAQILNVSNNQDFINFGGNTLLKAEAMLMGKSKLSLNANFPLIDHGKSFNLNANLNQIAMDDLEPILRPLALIQARSGIIKSVKLSVEASDDYAYGEMLMLYDNMKIDILNKSMKKGFLGTFFANALIKTENPSYLIPRKGPIYFERNKMRSIFNYWAEISILGMKTSMGLADRRTAKKVKKLRKK